MAPIRAEADLDNGARRLLSVLEARVDPDATFPMQVETALAASLAFLEADRDLARLLLTPCRAAPERPDRRAVWIDLLGHRLRSLAAADPAVLLPPPFLEPCLIDGVAWQIRRRLEDPGEAALTPLLPGLLEFLLVYYLTPAETAPHVGACLARSAAPGGSP